MYGRKYSDSLNEKIFQECMDLRHEGAKVVGTYCAFTPKEIIAAGGGIPVALCAGSYESAKKAEVHLPRNLCDLIKSSYGHGISDTCPYFHYADFIIADATCDGKKKMFELLSDIKETHVLDLPKTYETTVSHEWFRNELVQIKAFMEEKTGSLISNDALNDQIKLYNDLKRKMLELYQVNAGDTPIAYGREIKAIVDGISFECHIDRRIEEIDQAIQALRKRGEDPSFIETIKRKPRVLLTGCPTTHDKILNAIEENGAVIVATENCGGLKTIEDLVEEGSDDPLTALTNKYLAVACPCMSPNKKRFDIIDHLVKTYSVDAVVELTWHACHTYNAEATLIKRHVESEHNLPYLQVVTDYSEGDVGQLSTRIQALLELL